MAYQIRMRNETKWNQQKIFNNSFTERETRPRVATEDNDSRVKIEQMSNQLQNLKNQLNRIMTTSNSPSVQNSRYPTNKPLHHLPTQIQFNRIDFRQNRPQNIKPIQTSPTKIPVNSEYSPDIKSKINKCHNSFNRSIQVQRVQQIFEEPKRQPKVKIQDNQSIRSNTQVTNQKINAIEAKFQQEKLQMMQKITKLTLDNSQLHEEKVMVERELNKKIQTINKLNTRIRQLQSTKFSLQQSKTTQTIEIEHLKQQLSSMKKIKPKSPNFNEVLKGQLEQIVDYKAALEDKDDEIIHLNDIITSQRRNIQQLTNELNVQKVKSLTNVNNLNQKHQIQILDKQNRIKTLKGGLQTMQCKLKVAIKENKSKDQFIQQYLVGRCGQQDAEEIKGFFEKYKSTFNVDKLAEKLLEEQTQIERLKKQIQTSFY